MIHEIPLRQNNYYEILSFTSESVKGAKMVKLDRAVLPGNLLIRHTTIFSNVTVLGG